MDDEIKKAAGEVADDGKWDYCNFYLCVILAMNIVIWLRIKLHVYAFNLIEYKCIWIEDKIFKMNHLTLYT